MPANTRGRTAPRATLGVETLEGRVAPGAIVAHPPQFADPALVRVAAGPEGVYVAGLSVANQLHNPGAMRVVSRIVVNGELVAKVVGKPHFAAVGPALRTDADGHPVELGGTSVSVNGQAVGTFAKNPTVTREVMIYVNRHGVAARVLTYHIDGAPYVAPAVG